MENKQVELVFGIVGDQLSEGDYIFVIGADGQEYASARINENEAIVLADILSRIVDNRTAIDREVQEEQLKELVDGAIDNE